MYALEFNGVAERALAKQVYRTEGKLPDKLQNAPRLSLGLQLYLTAFFELNRERSIGYAGGEVIKRKAITEYAEQCGLDDDQTQRLLYLIPEMDNAFSARLNEKRSSAEKASKRKR